MIYQEYLSNLERSGIKLGLENISLFLHLLGDPQARYPTILVAGTNGKGSTACMISEILRRSGLRVGLFTSPHLRSPLERIRIDGKAMKGDDFDGLLIEVRGEKERQEGNYPSLKEITFFEFLTALAFYSFVKSEVEVAVVEVGLGARLDATNTCDPLISVITKIEYDHTEILGDTLREIAWEKSHISRRGRPVVSGEVKGEATETIFKTALSLGALPYFLDRDFHIQWNGLDPGFDYSGRWWNLKGVKPGMKGEHQFFNSSCAIAAAENLMAAGGTLFERVGMEAVKAGIEGAIFPGRFQAVPGSPLLIFDCAHNPDGAWALGRLLEKERGAGTFERVTAIAGLARKKDAPNFFRSLKGGVDRLILCGMKNPRGEETGRLYRDALPSFPECLVEEGIAGALRRAEGISGKDDAIVITGSHFLVGEAMEYLGIQVE